MNQTLFTKLVAETRKAQKAYFAYKQVDQIKENLLQASKAAEKASDQLSSELDSFIPLNADYQAMRRLQVQFFKLSYGDPRRKRVMIEAKQAESTVDKMLKAPATTSQTTLL